MAGAVTTSAVAQRSGLQASMECASGSKVLDLNVQYFPCKTCGSKFPSYYFVHKHRRMCHQDEEDNQDKEHNTNKLTQQHETNA